MRRSLAVWGRGGALAGLYLDFGKTFGHTLMDAHACTLTCTQRYMHAHSVHTDTNMCALGEFVLYTLRQIKHMLLLRYEKNQTHQKIKVLDRVLPP